jgi:hypothetical protein
VLLFLLDYYCFRANKKKATHVSPKEKSEYDYLDINTVPPVYETIMLTSTNKCYDVVTHLSSNEPKELFANQCYSIVNKSSTLHKKELTWDDLMIFIIPHLQHKWLEIGLALKLTSLQLKDIEETHDEDTYIFGVFQLWKRMGAHLFNWDVLLTALKSPSVNEHKLAIELEKKLL